MKVVDGFLEAVAADEPHGVIRASVAISPESIDGDDPGMFQSTGDLSFDEESVAAGGIIGVMFEDLLEGDLTVELGVKCDEYGAQAPPGMGPDDAEPLAVAGGRAHGIGRRAVGIGVEVGDEPGEGVLDVGVAQRGERLAGGGASRDGREAPTGIGAVLLEVQADHRLDTDALLGIEAAAGDEVLGKRPRPIAGPGLEGRDELALVDQAVLQGEQTEEEVAIGIEGGDGTVLEDALRDPAPNGRRRWCPHSGHEPDRQDYRMAARPR